MRLVALLLVLGLGASRAHAADGDQIVLDRDSLRHQLESLKKQVEAAEKALAGEQADAKKIGLELEVTPWVTQENEVRMIIKVRDTAIVDTVRLGGLTGDEYPVLANREIVTELVTGDGKTIFLGGIRKQDSGDSGDKLPGLGDMQFLGALFRNRKMVDAGQELIILATPTIMLDQQGADLITNAMLKAARREFNDPRVPLPVSVPEPPAPAADAAAGLPVTPAAPAATTR